MDESTLYGLDTLDFNPDMYYEDEWGTLGNLNSDKSSNGSNSPKIKLSRSNSKDILGGIGDFSQSKKNISAFLEHSKDVEGSLRVPSYIPSGSSGKRRSPERSQHSSGKRRGDYDDSFELNASASAGSGSKKKPKSSSSKNIGKSKGSKKSTTSSSSNSKGASKTKQEVSKKGNVKNRTDAKSKGNTSKQKKPLPDSKEEIRRRRKNFREKERRQEVNDGFTILMNLVGLHCQSDKARILNTAADTIQRLCETNEAYKKTIRKLKYENDALRRVTKQYIYKLTMPVAEVIKRNNGEITEESKKQMQAAIEAEQRRLQEEMVSHINSTVAGNIRFSREENKRGVDRGDIAKVNHAKSKRKHNSMSGGISQVPAADSTNDGKDEAKSKVIEPDTKKSKTQ
eukprot:g2165.t1